VLDKTGTLTRADAGGMEFQGGELAAEEGRWIASLARLSTHPLSGRIAKNFGSPDVPITRFKEIPGSGLEGEAAGHTLQIGSPSWLKQSGVSFREDPGVEMAEAGSSVFVAIDGRYRGVFRFENALRPEVEEWIGRLGRRYQLALLSGDNAREAARFGKIFGARAELRFNQTPADKLNFIRWLQARGHRVMMIGDGLNDAGALQQAEVGVAVVERVGVFSPASDVILDAAELPCLTPALELAQRTARIVRAGFLISLLYNAVGLSIAAAGFLSPVVCAILMPLSSATIVAFSSGATVLAARKLVRRSMTTPAARREADFPATLETRLLPKEAA
jgi:Cu+-exporting ATPase